MNINKFSMKHVRGLSKGHQALFTMDNNNTQTQITQAVRRAGGKASCKKAIVTIDQTDELEVIKLLVLTMIEPVKQFKKEAQ